MPVPVISISKTERAKILAVVEGHFCDLKAVAIKPAKLTHTIAALSNAEGGEVYIGIAQDKNAGQTTWAGFVVPEDANGHLQAFEPLFPLGQGYSYAFLESHGDPGLRLKADVGKSRAVNAASDGKVYVRRGAQNLPVVSAEGLAQLKRNKGLTSFETEPVAVKPLN